MLLRPRGGRGTATDDRLLWDDGVWPQPGPEELSVPSDFRHAPHTPCWEAQMGVQEDTPTPPPPHGQEGLLWVERCCHLLGASTQPGRAQGPQGLQGLPGQGKGLPGLSRAVPFSPWGPGGPCDSPWALFPASCMGRGGWGPVTAPPFSSALWSNSHLHVTWRVSLAWLNSSRAGFSKTAPTASWRKPLVLASLVPVSWVAPPAPRRAQLLGGAPPVTGQRAHPVMSYHLAWLSGVAFLVTLNHI